MCRAVRLANPKSITIAVLWIMNGGRPEKVHGIISWTQDAAPEFPDNTLGVLEYSTGGIGMIDLSAREMGGHRRFEVFGTKGKHRESILKSYTSLLSDAHGVPPSVQAPPSSSNRLPIAASSS